MTQKTPDLRSHFGLASQPFIDKDLALSEGRRMEAVLERTLVTHRFNTALLALFAALALTLSAVGVYGIMSQAVGRRLGEVGVRLPLGARRRQIFGLVVGQGLRLAGLGLALGLAAAAVLTRFLDSLLFAVGIFDPATFVLMPVVLVAAAGLACAAASTPSRTSRARAWSSPGPWVPRPAT
jgi:ABC-type antimicrobial peptide transport system permease subunit